MGCLIAEIDLLGHFFLSPFGLLSILLIIRTTDTCVCKLIKDYQPLQVQLSRLLHSKKKRARNAAVSLQARLDGFDPLPPPSTNLDGSEKGSIVRPQKESQSWSAFPPPSSNISQVGTNLGKSDNRSATLPQKESQLSNASAQNPISSAPPPLPTQTSLDPHAPNSLLPSNFARTNLSASKDVSTTSTSLTSKITKPPSPAVAKIGNSVSHVPLERPIATPSAPTKKSQSPSPLTFSNSKLLSKEKRVPPSPPPKLMPPRFKPFIPTKDAPILSRGQETRG